MIDEERENKIIGNKILIFRESQNMSRIKMAKILDITQQQLSKYESGMNRISAAKLAIISKFFNVDITYFYSDLLLNNIKITKQNREELNLLISYYLNIKNSDREYLILQIAKELSLNKK